MRVGDTFVSTGSGITLTVASNIHGEIQATQDGRTFERGVWHSGEESDTQVWAEVWSVGTYVGTLGQRLFHGTVDSVSRQVTQVG